MRLHCSLLLAAILLLPAAARAQTPAELLQKGIYAQQVTGDVDAAIRIYRQVVETAGTDRATGGRAQMMIVSALMQRGDLVGAGREFEILSTSYADQKDLILAMQTAMQLAAWAADKAATATAAPIPAAKLTLGTLQDGVYRHTKTGTEIRLPEGFTVLVDSKASGGGEGVVLADADRQYYGLWLIQSATPVAEIPAALDHDVDYKIHQRTVDGMAEFKIRPGTLMKFGSGTRQGVSVAFDRNSGGSEVEYDTWLRSDKTLAFYKVVCPSTRIAWAQDRLQILVAATIIP